MYYLYILQSDKDETYYTGYTSDLNRRLKQHNSGRSTYTKQHMPYHVVYTEEYLTERQAKDREKYVKKYGNIRTFLKSRFPRTDTVRD